MTSQSVLGEEIVYPSNGRAIVSAIIVTLAPGEQTAVHTHGAPFFAYILEGEITVDYGDKGKRTYRAGEALMEAMNVAHAGIEHGLRARAPAGGLHEFGGLLQRAHAPLSASLPRGLRPAIECARGRNAGRAEKNGGDDDARAADSRVLKGDHGRARRERRPVAGGP